MSHEKDPLAVLVNAMGEAFVDAGRKAAAAAGAKGVRIAAGALGRLAADLEQASTAPPELPHKRGCGIDARGCVHDCPHFDPEFDR